MQIILILLMSFNAHALIMKSDATLTPGSYCTKDSKDFLEFRYKDQVAVCRRNVLPSLKNLVYKSYQVKDEEKILYTIDHKIPLFAGGSNEQTNLWPQPREITSAKLEQIIFHLLNKDTINQKQAIDLTLSVK